MDPASARPSSRPLALILRVLPAEGRRGRVVGHAEVVDTGEDVALQTVDDLVELVRRVSEADDR